MKVPIRIDVATDVDAARARRSARALAESVGMSREETEAVVLATVELATNLVRYTPGGEIFLDTVEGQRGTGVRIESLDAGPGIASVRRAIQDGFSTGGGLGAGLPSVRRLMSSFEIESGPAGTRVVACKWPNERSA